MCASKVVGKRQSVYATREDFCKLFMESTNSLYLLSFLLTANQEKAEQCFVAGLDDCVDGNPVFHGWAYSWARRMIVRNAIQMVVPRSALKKPALGASDLSVQREPLKNSALDGHFAGLLALEDLGRFIYVLSVLERYSDMDCALLLDVSIREFREARRRVLSSGLQTLTKEMSNRQHR
ncbi:hypothetical protein [Silvibacterium dinghuense]|uniref:Uncharacterized protein n=1 Tax=Silvibacterium dinghuense TaxID=1560006 RepID=A0A4Q1SJX7_9BACT|nr:hypothetical protein [Silvibacterium dinghuense]RXS97590.1 hypothetical protein ESZ00_06810 [Silvibacterium dinghuense]GGH00294.1 hypothetical protein GCM10011586_14840 [Silvibacterium dinghuense]